VIRPYKIKSGNPFGGTCLSGPLGRDALVASAKQRFGVHSRSTGTTSVPLRVCLLEGPACRVGEILKRTKPRPLLESAANTYKVALSVILCL